MKSGNAEAEMRRPEAPPRAGGHSYRDELNFAEFPLASLSDRVPQGQKTLVFTDSVFDQGRRQTVTRKLTISASDEYGLPTALDDEVILGLIQLTNKKKFADRKVHFTRYELIKLLGWEDRGASYERIEQSMKRWLGVTLYYDKAWWSKEEQCWVDEAFHILDHVQIFDRDRRERRAKAKADDPTAGLSSFVWNEVVFGSFQAGYLKQIDLELYKTLESHVAKRMYRFLDKRFYKRARLEFDLREFACEHIGLSKNYHNGEIKRRMKPAITELERMGFLKAMPDEERFVKLHAGRWKVVFLRNHKGVRLIQKGNPALEKELIARGISDGTASELVARHDEALIREKLELVDWLVKRQDRRVSQNAAGFLYKAIEDDYELPKDFVSEGQIRMEFQSKQQTAIVQAEKQKAKRSEEEEALRAERRRFEEHWDGLSQEERDRFEEEALQSADRFLAAEYRKGKGKGGSLFKTVRETILLQHFQRTAAAAGTSL